MSLHEKNRARELAEVYQEETNKAYDLHIKLEELLSGYRVIINYIKCNINTDIKKLERE